jgi:hypothetical protein
MRTSPYRSEALTISGGRCKCQAASCGRHTDGKEYLTCKQHAKAPVFRPAVKVSDCPPPL